MLLYKHGDHIVAINYSDMSPPYALVEILDFTKQDWCVCDDKVHEEDGGDCYHRSARCDGVCVGNPQHVDGPETNHLLHNTDYRYSNSDAGWWIHDSDASLAEDPVTTRWWYLCIVNSPTNSSASPVPVNWCFRLTKWSMNARKNMAVTNQYQSVTVWTVNTP